MSTTLPPSDDGWGDDDDSESGPTTKRGSVGAMGAALSVLGARLMLDGTGANFRVLAPGHEVDLVLYDRGDAGGAGAPREIRRQRMARSSDGFHAASIRGSKEGDLYAFVVDGQGPYPDPASRSQPFGVAGPSELIDLSAFRWTDEGWRGRALDELVVYEVHVGTATPEGTFRGFLERLDHVVALGATAIELMPIAAFPGERGWGYDGVCPFAPHAAYGTPQDLAALVDAAHAHGLAVLLDVVWNHLGPQDNHLGVFFPGYFSTRRVTPWGEALAFDEEGREQTRAYVVECATQWVRDYHVDGLRLDATHAMVDASPTHVLSEIADAARAAGSHREVLILAEDERNEARLVREVARGGIGLDGVWTDDFHHEVRRIVAGDREGPFADFQGEVSELARLLQKGWLYEGQLSTHLGKPRGTPCFDIAPPHLVHALQNHDLVGNRPLGDRLHDTVTLPRVRAATTLLLATPFTPLLFMGQEFAASTPFLYFTDLEPGLGRRVAEARAHDAGKLLAFADEAARDEIPDPQAEATFLRSKLEWAEAEHWPGRELLALHRALLALRRSQPAMRARKRSDFDVVHGGGLIALRRRAEEPAPTLLFVVGLDRRGELSMGAARETEPGPGRRWSILLDTESVEFGGDGDNVLLEGKRLVLHGPGAVVLEAQAT